MEAEVAGFAGALEEEGGEGHGAAAAAEVTAGARRAPPRCGAVPPVEEEDAPSEAAASGGKVPSRGTGSFHAQSGFHGPWIPTGKVVVSNNCEYNQKHSAHAESKQPPCRVTMDHGVRRTNSHDC